MAAPSGDDFTDRYLAYLPVITGLVRKVLRDAPVDIDDVLQEIWILGRRNYASLREPGYFRGWIGRTSINAALMALRRAKRHSSERPLEESDEYATLPCPKPQPEEQALRREIRRAADRLAELHPVQFMVLYLVRYEGMTYQEAAEALGISEGAAKSDVFRATAKLRASLTAPKAA